MIPSIGKKGVCLCVLVCVLVVLSAQGAVPEEPERFTRGDRGRTILYPREKDPFLAGLLSWFMMGVGQMYVQEYTKGSIFIAADLVDKASLILLITHINNRYAPSDSGLIYVNWGDFDAGTKALIISYIGLSLGLRMYCVVDAYKSAQRYNERFFSSEEKQGFSLSLNEENIAVGYSIPLGR
jgi:hypothetical protein